MTDDGQVGRGLTETRLAALLVVGLGGLALAGAAQVRRPLGYQAVGPELMPTVVGIGLVVLGGLLLLRSTLLPDVDLARHVASAARATHWPTTLLTLAALLAYALLLGLLGYVLATAAYLPVGARILGSRRPVRDTVVAGAVALVVYIGFTEYLGVRLPAGLLEPLLP